MSEEESRVWVRGANSDTSLRTYGKEPRSAGPLDGPGGGGFGWSTMESRGGLRGRGRGIRGGGSLFDRNRGGGDEDERGIGRGRGFERSLSSGGGPDDPMANGSISPRKGYTRAPFADWRKPAASTEPDEWRSTGTGPSGRRWNQAGWRSNDDRGAGSGGGGGGRFDREYTNGGGPTTPSNSRWKPDPDYNSRSGSGRGRGGGFGSRGQGRNYRDYDGGPLPEWATPDDSGAAERGGTFDSAGKFQSGGGSASRDRDLNGDDDRDRDGWYDDDPVIDEEEIDPDDVPDVKPPPRGRIHHGSGDGGRPSGRMKMERISDWADEVEDSPSPPPAARGGHREAIKSEVKHEVKPEPDSPPHPDRNADYRHRQHAPNSESEHHHHLDTANLVSQLLDDDDDDDFQDAVEVVKAEPPVKEEPSSPPNQSRPHQVETKAEPFDQPRTNVPQHRDQQQRQVSCAVFGDLNAFA